MNQFAHLFLLVLDRFVFLVRLICFDLKDAFAAFAG